MSLPQLQLSPVSSRSSALSDNGSTYVSPPEKSSVTKRTPQRRLSWSELCPINSFLCPISGRLLHDPVITADGHSYERSAIENWFKTGSKASPMTGSVLPHTSTIRNHGLRAAINEYMSKLKNHKPFDDKPNSINDTIKTNEKRIEDLEAECSNLQREIVGAEQERLRLKDDLAFLEKKFIARAATSSSKKSSQNKKRSGEEDGSSLLDGLPIWLQRIAAVGASLESSLETQERGSGGGNSMGAFGALAAEELTLLCDEALRIAVNRGKHDNMSRNTVGRLPTSPIQLNPHQLDEKTSSSGGEQQTINLPWMDDFSIEEPLSPVALIGQQHRNTSGGDGGGGSYHTPPIQRYQVSKQRLMSQNSVSAQHDEQVNSSPSMIAEEEEGENQIEVLSEMFRCFDGKQWKEKKGWGVDLQYGRWFGISVMKHAEKKIVEIRLGFNNLFGSFPSMELSKLVNLRVLDLQRNLINGKFPHTLPVSLVHLELKDNHLSGPLPASLFESFTNLTHLSLAWNRLSGSLPDFGRLKSIITLDLSGNMFNGRIPPSIANLASCRNLWLHSNRFTGLIPTELADIRALRTLSLSENQFVGNIPAELGTLIYLKKLLLAKNKLNGRIPYELGNMQNLEYLLLTGNKFIDASNAAGRLQRHLPNCRIDV